MRKSILAALAVIALGLTVAKAQAPQQDTFTLDSTPVITVIVGHSFYTYSLLTFDGNPANGSAVDHLDTGFWDFTLPSVTLDACTLTSYTISPLNLNGPTYQSQTVVQNFGCDTHTVQTTGVRNYHKSWCRFHACFAEILPRPAITGTVTAQ